MKKAVGSFLACILMAGAISPTSTVWASDTVDAVVNSTDKATIYAQDISPSEASRKYYVGTRVNQNTGVTENIGVVYVEKYTKNYIEYNVDFRIEEAGYYDIDYYVSDGAAWKSFTDVYFDGEPTRQRIQDLAKTDVDYGWSGMIGNANNIDVANFIPKKWSAPKMYFESGVHTMKLRFQQSMNATIYSFDRITIQASEDVNINDEVLELEDFKWAEVCNKSFPAKAFTSASGGAALKIDSGMMAEDSQVYKAVFDAADSGEYKIEVGAGAYYEGRETQSPILVSVNGEELGYITSPDKTQVDFTSEASAYDTSDREISLYKFTSNNTASLRKGENVITFTVFDRKDNIGEGSGYRGYMAALDYVKAEKMYDANVAEAIFYGDTSNISIYNGDSEITDDADYTVGYESSDEDVLTVDADGTITGVGEGKAIVSVSIQNIAEELPTVIRKTVWVTRSGLYIKEIIGGKGGLCTFTLKNISDSEKMFAACIANYSDGRLGETKMFRNRTIGANAEWTQSLTISSTGEVKLFVWSNLSDMQPLTKSSRL